MFRNSIPRDKKLSKRDMMLSPVTMTMLNLHPKTEIACGVAYRRSAALYVNASSISSYFDSSFHAGWQYAANQRNEVFGVASIRIPGFLFLHDRHGDFSEIVKHQVVDRTTFNLTHGRVEQVTPESLSCCYPNWFFHFVNVLPR